MSAESNSIGYYTEQANAIIGNYYNESNPSVIARSSIDDRRNTTLQHWNIPRPNDVVGGHHGQWNLNPLPAYQRIYNEYNVETHHRSMPPPKRYYSSG